MRRRGEQCGQRGATAVEFAVVVPIVLMILFGIIEYGRYFFVRNIMDSAAREAARYAVVNSTAATAANVQSVANTRMQPIMNSFVGGTYAVNVFWLDPTAGNAVSYPFNNAPFGTTMGVTVSGTFKPLVPKLLNMATTIPLQSACYMLSEAN